VARKLQMLFAKRPFELRSRDGFEVHFGSEPFDSERFARELGSLKAIADLYAKAKLEPKLLFDSRASQQGLCSG
jgi:hypothetical protein